MNCQRAPRRDVASFALLTILVSGAQMIAAAEPEPVRRIALTFDDAPRPDTTYLKGSERSARLLEALRVAAVPQVAFFVNTVRLDAAGEARVRSYASAGHLVGNHTHTHIDLNRVGPEAFLADFRMADSLLRSLPGYRRWLRFPFLREGASVEDRDHLRRALTQANYLQAYVTVDNYDWYMDRLFQEAVAAGKAVDMDRLRDAYVDLLTEGVEFYDAIATRTLGRSPAHVLLLHENDLAALFIGDLVARLRERGWQIVAPEAAYADPIAGKEPQTLMLGQGRVIALAVDAGYTTGPRGVWEDEGQIEREFARRRLWR